jgi:kumamolisin
MKRDGTELPTPPAATRVGPLADTAHVSVSVYVRPPQPGDGVDDYIKTVAQFASDNQLSVGSGTDAVKRRVELDGEAGAFAEAWKVSLDQYVSSAPSSDSAEPFAVQVGPLSVPLELNDVVDDVVGFDTRPLDFTTPPVTPAPGARIRDVMQRYGFPQLTGAGQCIGIIRIGGAYNPADLDAHFAANDLHRPNITTNGPPAATAPANAALETTLDLEVAGTVAPGARFVVYYAKTADARGFVDVLADATNDPARNPSVLSISTGYPEGPPLTTQNQKTVDGFFRDCADRITVLAASGDFGSGAVGDMSQHPDGKAHVVFPASSPYVLACGGTMLDRNANEVVWNIPDKYASGGGVSDTFEPPIWQAGAAVPASVNGNGRRGRGVPDVAADAYKYAIYYGGRPGGVGGTSASAPLWAGLIALINQGLNRSVGFINDYLYAQYAAGAGRAAFGAIESGNNRCPVVTIARGLVVPHFYSANPAGGWNACTGLGIPNGGNLLELLANKP